MGNEGKKLNNSDKENYGLFAWPYGNFLCPSSCTVAIVV